MITRTRILVQFRRAGALLFTSALLAAAFDKTPLQLPPLFTSHGPIKSGGTIQDAVRGATDMLMTDLPLSDANLQQAQRQQGTRLLHIATAVTAVVPCYNLPGAKTPLNFTSTVLSGILLGRIRRWNDPAIVALNPSTRLPQSEIIIVGHGVEDGSTYTLTDFLSKTEPTWQQSVGRVRVLRSLQLMLFGQGADDIGRAIARTEGSFSYMELWAAKQQNLQVGKVRNHAGRTIEACAASIAAAAETAAPTLREDFRGSISDASGTDDYPIASLTWVVIPDHFQDPEKMEVIGSFLKWVLTDGQNTLASMNLAPLPRSLRAWELKLLESLH